MAVQVKETKPIISPRYDSLLQTGTQSQWSGLYQNGYAFPLVKYAAPLLSILSDLKIFSLTIDIAQLREVIINELQILENKLRLQSINFEKVMQVKYLLCAAFDEFIIQQQLATKYKDNLEKSSDVKNLVSSFYDDAWGGEKFFQIIDLLMRAPKQNLDALELAYICLSLGFSGKYQTLPDGPEQLYLLRLTIHRLLNNSRLSSRQPKLLIASEGSTQAKRMKFNFRLVHIIGLSVTIVLFVYMGLYMSIKQLADETLLNITRDLANVD